MKVDSIYDNETQSGVTLIIDEGPEDGITEKVFPHPKGMTFEEWLHDQWAKYLSYYDIETFGKLPKSFEEFVSDNCDFPFGIDPLGIFAEECVGEKFYSNSI